MTIPTMHGIESKTFISDRISTRVLFCGPDDGQPVLFLHGNLSSATWWEETMLALPEGFRGIAPDQRGYGEADRAKKIDATRGMRDLADDAAALLDALSIEKAHLVGHSLGGSVVWQFMIDYPQRVLTVTQVAPGSPYGFGGTKDVDGTPNYHDFAGSGAGLTNPKLVASLQAGSRDTDDPGASPRVLMNMLWKAPFKPAREEELLSGLMSTHMGGQEYPGDPTASTNWPGFAPGKWGPNNAISPKYADDPQKLIDLAEKPPVLWIRGADDPIVSDGGMGDLGVLGKAGFIPGWPGEDVYPPQPMVSQTRQVLERYQNAGGAYYIEEVIEDCAHVPYLEHPEAFNAAFHAHLKSK